MRRAQGLRAVAAAVLTGALALACDQRPLVNVAVLPQDVDTPALSTFARVTLAVDRCDVSADVIPELIALDVSPGSRPELELDIPPDVAVSVWVAAWQACPASACRTAPRPVSGACLCDQGPLGTPQEVVLEACSDFARFAAGADGAVTLSLSSTRTPALCPTARATCP